MALVVGVMLASTAAAAAAQDEAPERFDQGRFTVVYFPRDAVLAHALLASAVRTDSFPWLPRPTQRVLLAVAPDAARFRAWVGPSAPEWGAALAFPASRRIVMQGQSAGSDAGDPAETFRHELAHLALHEQLGDLPPRWFDEGYASLAAREWRREDVLAANVALAVRGAPSFDELEQAFAGGPSTAQWAYAFAYRAVAELAAEDRERGLTLFFRYWKEDQSLDRAVRRAFGITLSGFEHDFQSRTRRRYGALAVVADFSIVMFVMGVLVLPFFVARRMRDRKRLAAMVAADAAAEEAERRSALAALLGEDPAGSGAEPEDHKDDGDAVR